MPRESRTLIACFALALTACNQNGEGPEVLPVATVVIDELAAALMPGGTVQLVARALGPNGEVLSGRAITFSGGNSIVASVSPTGLVTAIAPGTVIMHASSEGRSGARDIPVDYPVPTISSIAPAKVSPEVPEEITVRGTGFYPGTAAHLGGVARLTTVVSQTEVRFRLNAGDVAVAGSLEITVVNPAPGGGTSARVALPVQPDPPCGIPVPIALDTPVDGALDATDCDYGGPDRPLPFDLYSVTTPVPMGVTFSVTSTGFDPKLIVTDIESALALYFVESATRPGPLVARMLLPARTFIAVVQANPGRGSYRFSATRSTTPTITNCEAWHVVPPLTLTETVTSTDCGLEDHVQGSRSRAARVHEWYWDTYRIWLEKDQTVTITLESAAFDAALWLYGFSQEQLAFDDDGGDGTSARIVFRAPSRGPYMIEAGPSTAIGATGAYTLRISEDE